MYFRDLQSMFPSISSLLFQLPYYIDGELRVTQTNAILRHIGRKHDLSTYVLIYLRSRYNS